MTAVPTRSSATMVAVLWARSSALWPTCTVSGPRRKIVTPLASITHATPAAVAGVEMSGTPWRLLGPAGVGSIT